MRDECCDKHEIPGYPDTVAVTSSLNLVMYYPDGTKINIAERGPEVHLDYVMYKEGSEQYFCLIVDEIGKFFSQPSNQNKISEKLISADVETVTKAGNKELQ